MSGRRGLMLLSLTILLSCGGKSLDAVTGGGDSGADSSGAGGTGTGAGGISGSAGETSGTGGHAVADAGGDHGSGGADAGNDTVSAPDAAIDHPKDSGNCPPVSGGFSDATCTPADFGLMCMFITDTGNWACTCGAGDLITQWHCTKIP